MKALKNIIYTISFIVSLSVFGQTAALAHYDAPTSTPPKALKTEIYLDNIYTTGDIKKESFFHEGEKQEFEFSFQVDYKGHKDFKAAKDYFKFMTQYNVSQWGLLYMVNTRKAQGDPFFSGLPDSEKLIGSHVECGKSETIAMAVKGIEKDLSTGGKIAIGVIGLVPGLVAGAAGAPALVTGGIVVGDVVFVIIGAVAQNDDDLGFGAGSLPANGKTEIKIKGKDGGADLTIRTVTKPDPANDAKCAALAVPSGVTPPKKTSMRESYKKLEQAVEGNVRKFAVALEKGWKELLPADWKGFTADAIKKAFDRFKAFFTTTDELQWEKKMDTSTLKQARGLMKTVTLDAARFSTLSMLDLSVGFAGHAQAVSVYRQAQGVASEAPAQALDMYASAYTAAHDALRKGQRVETALDAFLDLAALPRALSVYAGEKAETLVAVAGLPVELSLPSRLMVETTAPFGVEAKRVSGTGARVFLRFDTGEAKPGRYEVKLTARHGEKDVSMPVVVHVLAARADMPAEGEDEQE